MAGIGRRIRRAKVLIGIATGSRPLTGPRFVLFRINHTCNMRCAMCASFSSLVPDEHRVTSHEDMDFDLFRRVVDECAALGVEGVTVGGEGEPALHPRFMEMLACAKEKGFEGTTFTNGSRLTRENAERLVEIGWDRLNVSMNAGNKAAHEAVTSTKTWDRIHDGLLHLAEAKRARRSPLPVVHLSNTIFSTNYGSIVDMARLAIEASADELTIGLATLDDYAGDGRRSLAMSAEQFAEARALLAEAKKLADGVPTLRHNIGAFMETIGRESGQLRITEPVQFRIPCTVGYWVAVIDPDGAVHPCCQCEEALGRIDGRGTSLSAVWGSPAYARFRKAARGLPRSGRSIESCSCHSCDFTLSNVAYYDKLHPLRKSSKLTISPRR